MTRTRASAKDAGTRFETAVARYLAEHVDDRTARAHELIAAGHHPLRTATRELVALHPDAAPAGDRTAPGLRCGDCKFRQVMTRSENGRTNGRCASDRVRRDVFAWWPACADHQPAERARSGERACADGSVVKRRYRPVAETAEQYGILADQGLSNEQIAQRLGLTTGSLASALRRALSAEENGS